MARHPELYRGHHSIDHLAASTPGGMKPDKFPYASQPGGAAAGQSFFELWGKQWGSFSAFAGLDAVVIRDGFSTAANYERTGPFGPTGAASNVTNQAYIDGVRELFKATKQGRPEALVIGYSQASSAVRRRAASASLIASLPWRSVFLCAPSNMTH